MNLLRTTTAIYRSTKPSNPLVAAKGPGGELELVDGSDLREAVYLSQGDMESEDWFQTACGRLQSHIEVLLLLGERGPGRVSASAFVYSQAHKGLTFQSGGQAVKRGIEGEEYLSSTKNSDHVWFTKRESPGYFLIGVNKSDLWRIDSMSPDATGRLVLVLRQQEPRSRRRQGNEPTGSGLRLLVLRVLDWRGLNSYVPVSEVAKKVGVSENKLVEEVRGWNQLNFVNFIDEGGQLKTSLRAQGRIELERLERMTGSTQVQSQSTSNVAAQDENLSWRDRFEKAAVPFVLASFGAGFLIGWGLAREMYSDRLEESASRVRQADERARVAEEKLAKSREVVPPGGQRPAEQDSSFRSKLGAFLNAQALPAQEDAENLLQLISKRVTDEDLGILLQNQILVEAQRLRFEASQALDRQDTDDIVIRDQVCDSFNAYQGLAMWIHRIGLKTKYDFRSAEYVNWLHRDQLFEDNYRVLVAELPSESLVAERYRSLAKCNEFNQEHRLRSQPGAR